MPLNHHPKKKLNHKKSVEPKLAWETLKIEAKNPHRASLQKEDSSTSLVSAVSSDNGSLAYQEVKELFRDLLPDPDSKGLDGAHEIEAKLWDARVRSMTPHEIDDQEIRSRIQTRFERNYGRIPSYYGKEIPKTMDGLHPDIPFKQMLKILKAKEKYLLLKDMQNYWDQVRGPATRWWELKDQRFAIENSKCRKMLSSRNQQEQLEVREILIDMKRQFEMFSSIRGESSEEDAYEIR